MSVPHFLVRLPSGQYVGAVAAQNPRDLAELFVDWPLARVRMLAQGLDYFLHLSAEERAGMALRVHDEERRAEEEAAREVVRNACPLETLKACVRA